MTRAGAIGIALGLICMSFIAGWVLSRLGGMKMVEAGIAAAEAQHEDEVKDLREQAFVPYFNQVGPDGLPVDQGVALRYFLPNSEDSVTFSKIDVGLNPRPDQYIKIEGSGAITLSDSAGTRQVATLGEARCAEFFRKVISSGLAGYSEEAVQLKQMLRRFDSASHVCFAPTTRIRIVIGELKVNREFDLYVPDVLSRDFPDIIEYRAAVEIEKEILSFIP